MGKLIFVGLGLGGPKDMSRRAFEQLKEADEIFAEFYTSSMIDCSVQELEEELGRDIIVLDRKEVEEEDRIVEAARRGKVAFITAGDAMAATTHVDIRLRAEEQGITTKLIHGVSIFTAAASALGLQPYKFGRTVTLPLPEPGYFPTSPYDNILENKERNLHSLVLLDIKQDENRFMSSMEAVEWLMEAESRVGKGLIHEKTLICAAARVGSASEEVAAGYPNQLLELDMGPPLHCLVIPGKLHFMEAKFLATFASAPDDILEE
jgi:diphthine synthase